MATSTVAETSRNNIYVPVPVPSRYEAQKSRDWYTFGQFLKNHTPPLSMSSCNGTHVIEFLGHLDHLGKTKVHTPICPFFGHPKPPAPCACPVRQAWGSLDSLIGRLRAAYEEHGGKPDTNPFAARAVQLYLREVREWQEKSRGIVKKREPNPLPLVLQPRPGVSVPALVPRVFKMSAVPVSAPTVIRVGAGTAADTAPMPYPLRNRLPRSGSVNAGKGKGSSDKEIKPTTATTAAAATATAAAAPTAAASAAAVTPTAAATSPTTAATTATTDAVTSTTATADVVATTTAIADVVTTTTATADVVTTTIATKRSSSDGQTLQKERRTRVCRGNKK